MAALRRLDAGAPGLLYVDRHYDINTPQSTTDGALDWMGLAHALALPGCLATLTGAFGQRPLLEAGQVAWLGVEPRIATQWEREQAGRLGLHVTTSQALAADPAGTALAALSQLPLATPWTFARHRRTRGGGRCPWIWCYVRPSCVASPKKYLHTNYTPPPCRLQPSLR